MAGSRPFRVVVAGGGIATLELLLALRATAGDAVDVTVVAPGDVLVYRPEAVAEPFDRAAHRYPLGEIVTGLGARLIPDAAQLVDVARQTLSLRGGGHVPYDALVVAAGARGTAAVDHATTFRPENADELHWAIRELEDGSIRSLAFVAPRRCGWSLPLYELALMTAERVRSMDAAPGGVSLVTHEQRPLEVFGGRASEAVARRLEERGVALRTGIDAAHRRSGTLRLHPGGAEIPAERVVALPSLSGPGIRGLPLEHGFVRIDREFAVPGVPGVHAIGDAADYPVKQGGLATQQADVVAASVARAAGRDVAPAPFAGRLRATLWTGAAPLYLSATLVGARPVESDAGDVPPWGTAGKVVGARLAPFLADVDALGVPEAVRRAETP